MDTINSKPISIKEAMYRYGINSPSTWAEWLEKAGIQSFAIGRKRYIYTYQLDKLDVIARERNRPINTSTTGSIESFLPEHFQHFQSDFQEPKVLEVLELVSSITERICQAIQSQAPVPNPDESYIRLERYCRLGWLINSKDLALIIGLKNMPKSPYKAKGFLFERVGKEWKISKQEGIIK